mgnify:CR=1 FL=1
MPVCFDFIQINSILQIIHVILVIIIFVMISRLWISTHFYWMDWLVFQGKEILAKRYFCILYE